MINGSWIKLDDEMPKLNQEIEVETYGGEIFKTTLRTSDCRTFYFSKKDEPFPSSLKALRWRPIPERQPDFSKLNLGDFVVFTYGESKERAGGYITENNLRSLYIKVSVIKNDREGFTFEKISRIQRINFAENEIEEI